MLTLDGPAAELPALVAGTAIHVTSGRGSTAVHPRPNELGLLALVASHPGLVHTRHEPLERVWDTGRTTAPGRLVSTSAGYGRRSSQLLTVPFARSPYAGSTTG